VTGILDKKLQIQQAYHKGVRDTLETKTLKSYRTKAYREGIEKSIEVIKDLRNKGLVNFILATKSVKALRKEYVKSNEEIYGLLQSQGETIAKSD
jgi:hypothetical protein